MVYETGIISNKGGRKVNEDFADFYLSKDRGCWIVADGLGGHKAGEIASKLAVQTFLSYFEHHDDIASFKLKEGLDIVQQTILCKQKSIPNLSSMRTTMVVLTCNKMKVNWAHIGDSRLYHFRNGKIIAQTNDHSVCQALVNTGEITKDQIRFHEDRNRLYRVLGTEGIVRAALLKEEVQLQTNDAFLLCTDGFWEYILEEEMEKCLKESKTADHWLHLMLTFHETRVKDQHDNYSAIGVFIKD